MVGQSQCWTRCLAHSAPWPRTHRHVWSYSLAQVRVNLMSGSQIFIPPLSPDPYYCAGASLSENIKPMHPKKLHKMIVENNEMLFNQFLEFPKPILVAANGPAIGAAVTSALLCDGRRCHPQCHILTLIYRNPCQ